MLVLGIDFETTGLNPETDRVIEIGVIQWETDLKKVTHAYSEMIKLPDQPKITEEIAGLTGINENLHDFAFNFQPYKIPYIEFLGDLIEHSNYFVAHNAEFEKSFISQVGVLPDYRPWIDTMTDIPYPPHVKTRNLEHLAADHGFINPFPHRALFDVMTMLKLMSFYDFAEIEKYALSEKITVIANVSYGDRDKAKALGYRWVDKQWSKQIRVFELDEAKAAAAQAGFEIFEYQDNEKTI